MNTVNERASRVVDWLVVKLARVSSEDLEKIFIACIALTFGCLLNLGVYFASSLFAESQPEYSCRATQPVTEPVASPHPATNPESGTSSKDASRMPGGQASGRNADEGPGTYDPFAQACGVPPSDLRQNPEPPA